MLVALLAMALGIFGWQPMAAADGDEFSGLGPPSIAIADGSGFATGGTGMHNGQPADITVNVPAGATVKQVLLYWEGHFTTGVADDTIVVGGATVTGTEIGGGPTHFFTDGAPVLATTFRADITNLGLVSPGANTVAVSGLSYSYRSNGAGIVVIYDDGTDADLQIRDGSDLAYYEFAPPLDTTVPVTFTFAASTAARTATLDFFAASVADNAERPNAVDVTIGGATTRLLNVFSSNVGPEFDVAERTITVPAGATSMTVQALSVSDGTNNKPASFDWILAGLTLPLPAPPPPVPGATAKVVCAEGKITVTLTNTGGTGTSFDVFRGEEKLTTQPIAVGPGGTQTFDYKIRPADENTTVPLRAVAANEATFDLATAVDCDKAGLVAAVADECATQGDAKGVLIRLTNDGTEAGTFTVSGIDPVTVGPKSSKDVFVAVAEGQAYSIKITGTGEYQTTLSGTRDCQSPKLDQVQVCASNGTGALVVVTNPGKEAAAVTLAGETKTVPAGGRAEFLIPRMEDAPATTLTATSPGNPDIQVALPVQDCVGVSPVTVAAQTETTTTTTAPSTTTTTIPPEVAGVQLARTGFGLADAVRVALALVAGGALAVVVARRRRAEG